MEKNKMSNKIATALDYAIRDHEVGSDTWKYGYKINDKVYGNYMSNKYWESYKKGL